MAKYAVEQGSIYAPGWHVYEELEPRHYRSLGIFDEKSDAEEWLAHLVEQERRETVLDQLNAAADTLEAWGGPAKLAAQLRAQAQDFYTHGERKN